MVVDVLRGSKNQNIMSRGYHELSTYGILAELSEQEVRYYLESLLHQRLLKVTEGEYPVLKWTETSRVVIDGQQAIYFKKRNFKAPKEDRERFKRKESTTLHYDEKLFEKLRQLRLEVAREEEVPPFVVFSDRALQEMAVYFPQTQQEFSKINGVGPIKWVKYGERFLEVIRPYGRQKPLLIDREAPVTPFKRQQSMEETVKLYQQGHSLEELMQARQLARSTILTHLAEGIQSGMDIDLTPLVSSVKREAIQQAI
jgi:ATP-dependent DNA helicase RecQ